ncbi:MAG TPA: 5-(carboxyamino)imidazole ribonucleotide synthase [Candidatus Limnocylindrales bacterium]
MPSIGPYISQPATIHDWDPRIVDVHRRVAALINARRADLSVEHVGSSAVPGLPGKNVLDLGIETDPDDVPAVAALLRELGFQPQQNANAFPPTRPLLVGSIEHDGTPFRIHAHVLPRGHRVFGRDHRRDLAFRDALRADDTLRDAYAARKREIVNGTTISGYRYSMAKTEWIQNTIERLGLAHPPLHPPATIGILGGGQLGRMIGLAARAMGYRLAILDPDPDCPAASIADGVVVGRYDDTDAALAMAAGADVVTYELEHVSADLVGRLDWDWPVRPGLYALRVTQDRLEERRFLESESASVAPWVEVRTADDVRAALETLGAPLRVKAARGGYDGRSQVRITSAAEVDAALTRLSPSAGEPLLAERELEFEAELSAICARGINGRSTTFPVARNRHDAGILVESIAPAPVPDEIATQAEALVRRLAEGLDLVGTLTAELFLLGDGSLVVNELAPRVHNTGHWTAEACRTSQFEQHVRAICGLPLGSVDQHTPAALVNLLGSGPEREARVSGVDRALADDGVSVHLYDKRRVFERRKMGHLVALDPAGPEAALERARAAAAKVGWGS